MQFPHFMLKEIHEQPSIIRQQLDAALSWAELLPETVEPIETIQILACGTSFHAGLVGQYLFEQVAGIPTRIRAASEFLLAPLPNLPRSLTIAVTQSGETADTLAALRYCQQQFHSIRFGITNQENSSIVPLAHHTFYTQAGVEKSVAATKTFTAQLCVFYQLAIAFALKNNRLTNLNVWQMALDQIPEQMQTILTQEAEFAAIAQSLQSAKSLIILGSGINTAIAQEGALKLKETTYTHAEAYAAGEFLHGSIALLDPTIPVLAIAPEDETQPLLANAIAKAKSSGAPVFPLATALKTSVPVSPFLTVLPLQLVAYHLAILRQIDVDRPRNITKSLRFQ
jgi:glucosamine--fructose-6-phosphate aminotransferase (isomerizing)